jgi:hypothetical protein
MKKQGEIAPILTESYLGAWEIQPGISNCSIRRKVEYVRPQAGWEKGRPREYIHIHMAVHEDTKD